MPASSLNGTEFEPSPGVRGQWIAYAETFLFIPPPDNYLLTIKLPTGETCFGFDVVNLAKQFGIPPGDLMLNNQIGALTVATEDLPTIGMQTRTRYVFSLPHCGDVETIVNRVPIAGRA